MALMIDAIVTKSINEKLRVAFTMDPAWTRLEPQSISGDPTPGIEARVHDPLWMLTRQWQLGEFAGEDVGSPLLVHVNSESTFVTAWQPGDPATNRPAQALPDGLPLDPFIEREATPPEALGIRQRAEAGSQLVEMLADAGFDVRAALLSACPLQESAAGNPPEHFRLRPAIALFLKTLPDGAEAANQLEGNFAGWMSGASPDAIAAAQAWLQWFRSSVAPPVDPVDDCWIPDRLEYRFSVRAGMGDTQTVLRAPVFEGGNVDWYAFEAEPRARLQLTVEPPVQAPVKREITVLSTPLRYSGMPASRYWQFEDGQVNFGMIETQTFDLARLCLAEFALVYANDWLAVPIDVPAGSLTHISEVAYTNTFGERFTVAEANDANRAGRFRLFHTSIKDSDATMPGLFVPPTALSAFEGRAVEDLFVLRDEMANMVWAVENFVQGVSGDTRNRGDEERPVNAVTDDMEAVAEFQYLLESAVPHNWIPFVPVANGTPGAFHLRKGSMQDQDSTLGVLLRNTPYDLKDEEVPRAGLRLKRVPMLARAEDGSYLRWIGRRVSVGRGEGSSGLVFDAALKPG